MRIILYLPVHIWLSHHTTTKRIDTCCQLHPIITLNITYINLIEIWKFSSAISTITAHVCNFFINCSFLLLYEYHFSLTAYVRWTVPIIYFVISKYPANDSFFFNTVIFYVLFSLLIQILFLYGFIVLW